ncbi:hypothetical protein RRU94_02550 [Domibacillus sp. DTU_2020_1001157_1_SI_ALB_TIR_016]|uniref:hypothetical protein n=1 Tax=Domibacillus sp. DTU_2020_1001157_1_SI_ALB_TIR_016 TaxID=3077789 RepID=UPI0028E76363|nr:hypothetical protein [Domibacillus sp. DTU_2020_1001157_1_SI_ALB_TIR_016]WNS78845.1 hypothetical protein RRU94_02550 [Domibacillus sp. DTU_2020_1001157_1_SI_ALB_TIR_016]
MKNILSGFLSRAADGLGAKFPASSDGGTAKEENAPGIRLVAVGEVLGGFKDTSTPLTFSLKYGNEEIILDQFTYNVWESVKMTLTTREETVSLMKRIKPAAHIHQAIDELLEKKLLIEWKDTYNEEYFEQFALIPKGRVTDIKEDDYYVLTFPKSEPIALSMMGYFIWRHAHPFLSCNSTIQLVHQSTGVETVLIKEDFIRWIPILVMYDVLSIVPNR